MTRNLKVLGLAFVAMLAFGALSASGASAQGVLTSDGPFTLTGTETGEATDNSLTAFGRTTTCPGSTYTGHVVMTEAETDGVEHKDVEVGERLIPSGSSEATITPHYVNCKTAGFETTVEMHGCDYDFKLGKTNTHNANEPSYDVRAFLVCPQGVNGPTITVYGSTGKHESDEPFCVTTVTPDPEGYGGLSAVDTTNGHVDITGTIEGVESHRESPTGSILCTSQTDDEGVLHVHTTIGAHNEAGEPTNIGLSHES